MSLLCPIDFRYGRPKMKGIFEEESRLQRLLEVEAALARVEAKVGLIPEPAAAEITKKATTKRVTVKRVQEIEEETRHDLMAVVLALTEACDGEAGKYVHLGATSNDILDSATALQLRDAIRIVTSDLDELIQVLAGLATKHKRTIMLGRTHGQAAETGRQLDDGPEGEPGRVRERVFARARRTVPRHPGPRERATLA